MAGKKRTYSPYVQSCLDKCKSEFTVSKSNKRKSVKKSPIFSIDDVGGIEDLHKKIREFKDFLISKGLSEDEIIEHLNLIDKDMKTKKYGLVWEDREEDVYEQAKKKFALLTEVEDREIKTDDSKPTNLLIEGDNLESLLSLQYTHKGLVNVIYIDPPYNTGNKDFRYNDRYVDKEDTWRHSSWLSFMHKRLVLAKDLLSDDGVIFISIDDNEFAQLKLLCDEVFGETNFISTIIWRKQGGGKQDSKYLANNCEYILCYRKTNTIKYFTGKSLDISAYNKTDENGLLYRLMSLDFGSLSYSKALDYPILLPNGSYCYPGGSEASYLERQSGNYTEKDWRWRCSKSEFEKRKEKGLIEYTFNKKTNRWKVQERLYLDNTKNVIQENLITDFTNRTANNQIKDLFGKKVFSYPKPTNLLDFILNLYPNKNAIVLDFFAGSGTTGHAVMELNKEDGGNRQFILCTNNENNICEEVTYQRLNKVINGYTTPKGKVVEGLGGNLKYYKTAMIDKGETYNENKSKLVSNMNSLISIKENAFDLEVSEDTYVTYSSNSKSVLIYNDVHIDATTINNCIDYLNKNRDNKELVVYLPLDDASAIDNVVLPTYQDLGIRFELIPKDYINQYKRLEDNRG